MPEGITTGMYQPAPPANPLGVLHEFASAQNQLNQARSFQMEFAARQALGPMLRSSVRPDGSIDTAKLFQQVAAHPATGWKLPDLVEGFLKNQLTTEQIAKTHLENAGNHFKNMQDVATGILANARREGREHITPEEYTAGMAKGIPMGLYGAKDLVALFKGNPDLQPLPPGDPREYDRNKRLYNSAYSMANSSRTANETVNKTLGMMPPSEAERFQRAMTPHQVWSPESGRMESVPLGTIFPTGGFPGATGTTALTPLPGAAPAPAPAAAAPVGAGAPSPAPAPTVPGAAPAAPSEIEKGQMENFNTYNKNLQTAATKALNVKQTVNELRQTLEKSKTGGGTSFYMAAAKLLQGVGISNEVVDRVAGGNLASLQEADKLFLQNAVGVLRQQLLSTAGEGSAGRLALAEFQAYLRANPNVDMDPRATKRMLDFTDMLSSGTLYEQKKLAEALAKHGPGKKMWNWPAYWSQQLLTNPKLKHFLELPAWEDSKGGK